MDQPAADRSSTGLSQLVTILGTIVAPTTLVTSLLFYFGWSHAYYFFDYFGVHSTLLGLTGQDYVQRSLDGLFVPMTVVAGLVLAALWGHVLLRRRLVPGSRRVRALVPAIAITGLVLVSAGVASIVATTALDQFLAVAPLTFALGVLLVMYAVQAWRSGITTGEGTGRRRGSHAITVAEWGGVFILVGLSLFWAANDYSAAVGRSRARQFAASLPAYPSIVLYSERNLSLHAPGVRETRCADPEAAYRFRYEGLKLVTQSGDQYLFLPEKWSRADSVAFLIPRNESLRLEFLPRSARTSARPATC